MRFKTTGNKRDTVSVVIKSDESAITIKAGSPVNLQCDGTDDGLAVTSINAVSAAKSGMFFGLAITDIAPGANGEATCFGFFDSARLRIATRAASTDVWASFAAGAVGDALSIVTATGVVAASVSADQALSNAGSADGSLWKYARLGQTYASATTQASSLTTVSGGTAYGGATATACFTTVKVLLRAL